eukprot:gnl/Chilomastix_cuspidata/2461.p2 GENE.gnl/Chilomastix_cuspidata/2461~~gnl/Chilomastix_cuspidata/2461.p2  ORF type:complete len:237 (+),score=98.21 gnl/Chilomastix_cuspidata/2461:640-1350(+)
MEDRFPYTNGTWPPRNWPAEAERDLHFLCIEHCMPLIGQCLTCQQPVCDMCACRKAGKATESLAHIVRSTFPEEPVPAHVPHFGLKAKRLIPLAEGQQQRALGRCVEAERMMREKKKAADELAARMDADIDSILQAHAVQQDAADAMRTEARNTVASAAAAMLDIVKNIRTDVEAAYSRYDHMRKIFISECSRNARLHGSIERLRFVSQMTEYPPDLAGRSALVIALLEFEKFEEK